MEPALGLRVVRGPDWEWGDQDGGEGYVGTVVELGSSGGSVVVYWDKGLMCKYRCGEEGKYDLRILDSAQAGIKHCFMTCKSCLKEISGMLWKCVKCLEYFLCSQCYMRGCHSVEHPFMRMDTEDAIMRVKVGPRARAIVREVFGIFRGAVVVRGRDWKWKDQDGGPGNTGTVNCIKDWKTESARSIVEVMWNSQKKKNNYRLGHGGKVDVQFVTPSSGGMYYPDHLPTLGAPFSPPTELQLAAGDRVKVALDPDIWKDMQRGHGGWNDLMANFIGSTGVIQHIDDTGLLLVNYMSNAMFHINPVAVTKVETPLFKAGDVVSVLDDMTEVRKLQKGHGEWAEDMAQSLGQVGRVTKVLPAGDLQVAVNGRRWIYNPVCLKYAAPEEKPQEDINEIHMSPLVKAQLESLMESKSPEVVPVASAAGDVSTIRSFLIEQPNEVDATTKGKTGLHVAAAEGYVNVIKTLLEFKANVNATDEDGETPLHYCAHLNQVEAAKELMEHEANPNTTNALGIFPLAVCTAFGNYGVLKVLVKYERTDRSLKDLEGNTALHVAVLSHRTDGVKTLLDAGAKPTTPNEGYFTPILEAAKNGFYAGMEQFMQQFPEEVNFRKADDGHTALHIAAANDYLDIICLLASMDTCELDAANALKNMTPLHLAAQRGFTRIIERLVGYGANPSAMDNDGNTPLSLVIMNKDSVKLPSEDSPEIMKVSEAIHARSSGAPVDNYVAVACFLAREGAGTESLQSLGCPADVSSLISSFASRPSYCGTLQRSPPTPSSQPQPSHPAQGTMLSHSPPASAGVSEKPKKLTGHY